MYIFNFKQYGVPAWKLVLRIILNKTLLIEELRIAIMHSCRVGKDIALGHTS